MQVSGGDLNNFSINNIFLQERVEACKAKDKEIKNLKDLNGMVEKTDETENKFSPTLFSENCTFLDDLVESDQDEEEEEDQGDFSLIARGTPPTSTSSPLVPAKTVPVTSNEKLKKIVPVPNNKVVNGRAIAIPTRGWRTKPEQLSFSNINNKTKIHVPQKTTKMKTLTLKESFKRAAPLPAAVSKTNPKRIAVEKVPAVVKMEIPSDDEDEAMFQTPKKKSDDLEDFCEDCRRVNLISPVIEDGQLN